MKTVWTPAASFKKRKGFTITEMLVVIGIVGILMGVVMVGLKSSRNRARVAAAKNDIRFYGMTFQQYRNGHLYDTNKWPIADMGDSTRTTSYDGINPACSADQKKVPSVLITEGLWKEKSDSQFCYYRTSFGNGEEVGIIWPGLQNDAVDVRDLGTIKSGLLLIIQKPNYILPSGSIESNAKNRYDVLTSADKNKVIFLSGS